MDKRSKRRSDKSEKPNTTSRSSRKPPDKLKKKSRKYQTAYDRNPRSLSERSVVQMLRKRLPPKYAQYIDVIEDQELTGEEVFEDLDMSTLTQPPFDMCAVKVKGFIRILNALDLESELGRALKPSNVRPSRGRGKAKKAPSGRKQKGLPFESTDAAGVMSRTLIDRTTATAHRWAVTSSSNRRSDARLGHRLPHSPIPAKFYCPLPQFNLYV